jgi:hypothetical protein
MVDLKGEFGCLSRMVLNAAKAQIDEIRGLPAHADISGPRGEVA